MNTNNRLLTACVFTILFAVAVLTFQKKSSEVECFEEKILATQHSDYRAIELLVYTNHERENKLTSDDCLEQKARERAEDMFKRDFFSHTDPETGERLFIKMVRSCGDFDLVGENLVMDFKTIEQAHVALMNSPLHKENIVNKKYSKAGFGCYEDICVQFFAGLKIK